MSFNDLNYNLGLIERYTTYCYDYDETRCANHINLPSRRKGVNDPKYTKVHNNLETFETILMNFITILITKCIILVSNLQNHCEFFRTLESLNCSH